MNEGIFFTQTLVYVKNYCRRNLRGLTSVIFIRLIQFDQINNTWQINITKYHFLSIGKNQSLAMMVLRKMWYFGDCCELLTGVWMGVGTSETVWQYLVTLKMIILYNLEIFTPLQGPCSLKCGPRTSSINIICELNIYAESLASFQSYQIRVSIFMIFMGGWIFEKLLHVGKGDI